MEEPLSKSRNRFKEVSAYLIHLHGVCVKQMQNGGGGFLLVLSRECGNEPGMVYRGPSFIPCLSHHRMLLCDMARGQSPVPPVNIPTPTKIPTKMGGECTCPKMGSQNGFDNHRQMCEECFSLAEWMA